MKRLFSWGLIHWMLWLLLFTCVTLSFCLPVYRTPVVSDDTLQIQGGAVCIQLNTNCVEAPSDQGFTAELQFTLNDNEIIIVFGELSQCDNGVSGFKFRLKISIELELETFPVTITLVSNGTVIQTINSLNVLQEPGMWCTVFVLFKVPL